MRIVKYLIESFKVPLIIMCMFFFGGIGFSIGVKSTDAYQQLLSGRAIIVTAVDLRRDSE